MRRQVAGTVAVFSLFFLATLGISYYFHTPTSPLTFDRDAWISGDRDTRARMVGSLLEYPLAARPDACVRRSCPKESALYKASLAEVVELLGPPAI